MPGKYLEFVKAGRYAVPVEISFIPTTYTDEISGKEAVTSKWATRTHWKVELLLPGTEISEIKALLKPAIDSCTNSNSDGFSKSPHISYGQEVGLGYVLCVDSTKEKSPFLAVLDAKKNCWTDDEDEFDQLDEICASFRDYGGTHRTHIPTKIFVKACVIKRTASATNDSKKLKKELGFKGEDLRNYFQNSSPSSTSAGLTSSLHEKDWIDGRNKRFSFGNLGGGDPVIDKIRPFVPSLPRRLTMERPPGAVCSRNGGTYYEEQDDDEDSEEGYQEVDLYNDEKDISDDGSDFSLPDIDAPQMDIQLKKDLPKQIPNSKKQINSQRRDNQRQEKISKLPVIAEASEPRKGIKLVEPSDDQFAWKIGAAVSVTNQSKTNSSKTKKRPAPAASSTTSLSSPTKKLKEARRVLKEAKKTQPAKTPDEMALESIFQDVLRPSQDSDDEEIKGKKGPKPKKPEDANESTKNETTRISKRTGKPGRAKNAAIDSPPQSFSESCNKESTSTSSPGVGRGDNENENNQVTKQPTKKVKKKKKLHETKEIPSNVKMEKLNTMASSDPEEFAPFEPAEVDLLDLEFDPDMPILSPEVANQQEDDSLADEALENPVMPELNSRPKKDRKAKAVFDENKKRKPKKPRASKSTSTSTQTQVVANGRDKLGPESINNTTGRGLRQARRENDSVESTHNSRESDMKASHNEDLTQGSENVHGHAPQEPAAMMPPPSRPAPRSPRKGHAARTQLRNTKSSGFPINPVGVQGTSDPSKLSTIQLMCNPSILRAGVGLLKSLSSKKMTAIEVGQRLGFKDLSESASRMKREISPDITSFPQLPANRERESGDSTRDLHHTLERTHPQSDEDLSDNDPHEEGESLIRELLDRVNANSNDANPYEPEGDEYDLSQKSMCYLNIFPGYAQKSRLFKIHCKNVIDLTFDKLLELYIAIRPALRQIFEGEVPNARSNIYLQGQSGLKKLKEMCVSLPFEHDQTSSIITLLFEYFIPDPQQRPKWIEYVNYVLLPEALINIYARLNEIPYDIAEKEMRYQGCYDDSAQ